MNLDKTGANISFTAKKNKEYKLYKTVNEKEILLESISEKSGIINILDSNIFKYNEITYYLIDEQNNISEKIEIKPKDYLMNSLNNQIKNNKRKWYVKANFN